jgi:hypothetical protein
VVVVRGHLSGPGDRWGNQVFGDLEAFGSPWICWNLIPGEKGGPWLVLPIHRNPDRNVQHPLVVINRSTREVTYTATFVTWQNSANSCGLALCG